jgi:hypothetical protein
MLSKAFNQLRSRASFAQAAQRTMATSSDAPKRVVVTGAAGQISYSALFRIARYTSSTFYIMIVVLSWVQTKESFCRC